MRRREVLGLLATWPVATGCVDSKNGTVPAVDPHPKSQAREAKTEFDEAPVNAEESQTSTLLASMAVSNHRFWRVEVYTWTTQTQASALRAGEPLLSRTHRGGSPSYFDSRVARLGGPMAALLATRPLSLRRFAWSNAWATCLGWPGESYGDQLVRVALAPDAIVARLDTQDEWAFAELDGHPVPESTVLAAPERLAAVFHVSKREDADPNGPQGPLREVVLVNESRLLRWELGTPAVAAELERSRQVVALVRRHFSARSEQPWPEGVLESWDEKPPPRTIEAQYRAALAFGNEQYAPRPALATELAAGIPDGGQGSPFVGKPGRRFNEQKPLPRKPPKIPKQCWGTLC